MLIVLLLLTMSHDTGRWCTNDYCMMCNRLHMKYGHNQTITSYSQYVKLHSDLHEPPIFDSTPHEIVDAMLEAVQPTKDDILYDLGCGDGRILIAAVKKYKCKAVGIEIDPKIAALAQDNINKSGVSGRITLVTGDARNFELSDATIVTMYLFPDLMKELEPSITHATRIVSYSHAIPNRRNKKLSRYPIYVWTKRESFL